MDHWFASAWTLWANFKTLVIGRISNSHPGKWTHCWILSVHRTVKQAVIKQKTKKNTSSQYKPLPVPLFPVVWMAASGPMVSYSSFISSTKKESMFSVFHMPNSLLKYWSSDSQHRWLSIYECLVLFSLFNAVDHVCWMGSFSLHRMDFLHINSYCWVLVFLWTELGYYNMTAFPVNLVVGKRCPYNHRNSCSYTVIKFVQQLHDKEP